jgi:tryptophan halogenase
MAEDEAAAILLGNLEGARKTEPRTIRFKVGRQEQFWVKNCIAIGLSSGFLEPLESTSIHLIQSAAVKLANLFPNADFDPAPIAEYNRQVITELEGIRDFIIMHYHVNQRSDSPFWIACREMTVPETLSRRIDLFRRTGRLFRENNELFHEVGWMQVLMGQNVVPESYDLMADALPESDLHQFLADLGALMNAAVAKMPTHADWLARNCAAPAMAA